uniref:Uncharacterized protein n=1 Tax=Panagrolaimus superbus TaxID=310955 RepID=A0A914XUG6_9BILA
MKNSFVFFFFCCSFNCINGSICKSYNSSTEIFTGGINLDLAYEFTDKSFILTITNFTSASKINATVESYSADTQTQTCEVESSSPYKKCVLKLSKYFAYDISVNFEPYLHLQSVITTIIYNGTEVINPSVSAQTPCMDTYTHQHLTWFCCVL